MVNPRAIARQAPWDDMRRDFAWDIPAQFNIAQACCDAWAEAYPDRTALIDLNGAHRVWTYAELSEASDRLAGALAARGVSKGDRIGILLPQRAATMIAHFAAYKLGAIALPLFTLFGPDALDYRLRDSGAAVVITDAENLSKVAALKDGLPDLHTLICTEAAPGTLALDDLLTHPPLPERADTGADDPAVMIYTSGTTGEPKGVLHAHRFLIGHLPNVECHLEGMPQPGDIGWTPADWAWIGGLMDLAMPCLYHGVPLIARRFAKFDATEAWDLIDREQVTLAFLPPTALKLMRQVPVPPTQRLRAIGSGGEALGPDLLDWGRNTLGAPINELYGQTECNLVLASCAGTMQVRPGSMGRAVPGMEVTIRDPDTGDACPPGTRGEICVAMPNPVAFLRYWNKSEKTAEKVLDGWLRTGDLGTMDKDGFVTFAARDDDVITSSGYRIGPTEIEACLASHPDVLLAAVVGLPDPKRTEAVTAFVTPRDGATPDEATLIQRVRDKISPHVAPRRVITLDTLPTTATGKIQRRVLRDTYATLYTSPPSSF